MQKEKKNVSHRQNDLVCGPEFRDTDEVPIHV